MIRLMSQPRGRRIPGAWQPLSRSQARRASSVPSERNPLEPSPAGLNAPRAWSPDSIHVRPSAERAIAQPVRSASIDTASRTPPTRPAAPIVPHTLRQPPNSLQIGRTLHAHQDRARPAIADRRLRSQPARSDAAASRPRRSAPQSGPTARPRDRSDPTGSAVAEARARHRQESLSEARQLPSAPAALVGLASEPGGHATADPDLVTRTAEAVQARLLPRLLAETVRRVDARLGDLLG